MSGLERKKIKATWSLSEVQAATALSTLTLYLSAIEALEQLGSEALTKFRSAAIEKRVAHLKVQEVKSPIDLVHSAAEFQTNVFGFTIDVWGNERSATLQYQSLGCYETALESGIITRAQVEKMFAFWEEIWRAVAEEFNLSLETRTEEQYSMTFGTMTPHLV